MDYDDGQCAICLFPHVHKSKLCCGHVFCYQCLFNWCRVKLQCPTCRRSFNSFVTSNMPVSAFQNNSFRTTRNYCPVPDVVPQVINVPINADSFTMTLFLFNDRAFVKRILRTQRYDLGVPIAVNLLIVDEPDTEEFRRASEQLVRRTWQFPASTSRWRIYIFASTL